MLLAISAGLVKAQVQLVSKVEEGDIKANKPFHLTVVLEIRGDNYTQESRIKLPDFSNFNYLGDASDQHTFGDPGKNIIVNQFVYQVTLEPKEAGKFRIGSALVKVNGTMYKTEPLDIVVKPGEKKTSAADDLYLSFDIKDKTVYENQPAMAVLRAYSSNYDNFRRLGAIRLPVQEGVAIRPVSLERSEIETAAGNRPASQTVAVFMIFPTRPGIIRLKPATAAMADAGRPALMASNQTALNVRRLPVGAPKEFHNAVGQFSVDLIAGPQPNLALEKPFHTILKLSGTGNLSSVQLPSLSPSPDYIYYPPKISTNYRVVGGQLQGEITQDYIVVPKRGGDINLRTEGFAYFNPANHRYIDLGEKLAALHILTPEEEADKKSALDHVSDYTTTVLQKVNAPTIKGLAIKSTPGKDPGRYLLMALCFTFLAGITAFFIKRKKKSTVKTSALPPDTTDGTERDRKSVV